ncbi:MAG: 8-oxoguanine deaminase [Sumerlaeia bacterium]
MNDNLLLEGCKLLACFNDAKEEFRGIDVYIKGGLIADVGADLRQKHQLPMDQPRLDCSELIVLPGFVNVHHHLFQSLTRVSPRVQNAGLFEWLLSNYQVWQHMEPEELFAAAQLSFSEMLLSGVTTTTDHHYLFPQTQQADWWDQTILAAQKLGMRFHATRGSMTLGVNDGGLPPMSLVESTDRVLADYDRVLSKWHSADETAMTRIALAPCAPFNCTEDLFRETAKLAEHHNVLMHTHLAETEDENTYCLERFGCRPLEYVARLGWEGPKVWFAHCVTLNDQEIRRCAETGTGVAHCPSANSRLGSGIAPIKEMIEAGVRVGIGVDGSSSNDSGSFLKEMRLAFHLQRSKKGPDAVDAREVLSLGTRGGASILHNNKLGRIEVGACADLVLIRTNRMELSGGSSEDPLAAIVFCGLERPVDYSLVNGRFVVFEGVLSHISEHEVCRMANQATNSLIKKSKL